MAHIGKRIADLKKNTDLEKIYSLSEAIDIVKKSATAKFDETIDISIMLGIDGSKQDQAVRNVVNLPNGTGKT